MMTTHPSTPTASKRIATIDVMRAIIMLLMLFVNDIPGVDGKALKIYVFLGDF